MPLLNKYMHPRNIYRTPPNFKDLAIAFPEFRSVAKQDISGKVTIDFQDQSALRALTSTLLKKDFDLDVDIPPDRLVPTLPLRLNYVLWIEDLLESTNRLKIDKPILGLDVGTGATCIYPLLAAKKNKWHMQGTEIDTDSFECANRNIVRNGLQELIKIKQVDVGSIFSSVLDDDLMYDFSMSNPPFFSSEKELESSSTSRSSSRPSPHNARTGAVGEVIVEGGEISVVTQMIHESSTMKTKIRIYTTMVGRKSSVSVLKDEIMKSGATSSTQTEFCQGHTTRWGLAWTFASDVILVAELPKKRSLKKERKKSALKYIVPKTCELPEYTVTAVCTQLEVLLDKLQMKFEQVEKTKHNISYMVIAFKDTWSHQRRKRRKMKPKDSIDKLTPSPNSSTIPNSDNQDISTSTKRSSEAINSDLENSKKRVKLCDAVIDDSQSDHAQPKELDLRAPVLKVNVVIKKVSGEINIELSFLEGTLGWNAVHQILQYLRNHF